MPVYFDGEDAAGDFGLWVTGRTGKTTYEVGGERDAKVKGVSGSGLVPNNIADFKGDALFSAGDGQYHVGLWISNGTAKGTHEIGGESAEGIKGADHAGFSPTSITAFGKKALFLATDAQGHSDTLWVTDGTAKGTHELGGFGDAGIKGADKAGFDVADLFVFDGKAAFWAMDSDHHEGLWITNGASAGATEIGGLKDAGVKGGGFSGDATADALFGTVGGNLLFSAIDGDGDQSLWLTNGSAAGTKELGGLRNHGVKGGSNGKLQLTGPSPIALGKALLFSAASGLWRTEGTAASTKALSFQGATSIVVVGKQAIFTNPWGLEVTDGTPFGTFFLGGAGNYRIKNIDSGQFAPSDLTSLGNKAVFTATDKDGDTTLWVTNGTVSGTTEIGGLGNAHVKNAPSGGLDPSRLVALGSNAYFESRNALGESVLWVTNGAAAGTFELGPNSVRSPIDLTPVPR
jgi:hypothetical protein